MTCGQQITSITSRMNFSSLICVNGMLFSTCTRLNKDAEILKGTKETSCF